MTGLRLLSACLVAAISVPATAADVDYLLDVKPLFAAKCGACHGVLKQEGGLRLDASQLIRKGGESGPVVIANDPGASPLMQRVSATEPAERMPPEGEGEPLKPEQLAILRSWIEAGAVAPESEEAASDPREHWSFQKPVRPEVPAGMESPVDALLDVRRRERGLEPVASADAATLLRRLFFDLTGLPPTPEDLQAFLADPSDAAYEKIVDDLLSRPEYGERWGRHWMDVWRYSDWDGFGAELRGSQKHIWHWRDWIIESLNADKPYDEMVREMLAGDEIAPADPNILRATGFLSRGYYKFNRQMWMDNVVEHTGKAFLGLTLNCAKCHDHKYDPLTQRNYYEFQAFFEPYNVRTDRVAADFDLEKDGLSRVFDAEPTAPTYMLVRGDERNPDKSATIAPAAPSVFQASLTPEPVPLPIESWFPYLAGPEQQSLEAAAANELKAAQSALAELEKSGTGSADALAVARRKVFAAEGKQRSLAARMAADRKEFAEGGRDERLAIEAARAQRNARLLQVEFDLAEARVKLAAAEAALKPDDANLKKAVDDATAAVAKARTELTAARAPLSGSDYEHLGKSYPQTSSGRRRALAAWITGRDNPLAARVAVNHLWLRHFGRALVDNTFDFGLRSPRPRHAALLDWLAVELMENGWRMKPVHRQIVLSRTYRLASASDGTATADLAWTRNRELDRDNLDFWRADVRRLDAESVRDAVLFTSGSLDRSRGGPDIDFQEGEKVARRSVYFRHAYEKQMRFLTTFDAASPNECYRRSESIIPHQALAMANSRLTLTESRVLAETLWSSTESAADPAARTAGFVTRAFERLLSRSPSAEELSTCVSFLATQRELLQKPDQLTAFEGGDDPGRPPSADPDQRSREDLIHVLYNHNDFATVR